MPSSEPPKHTQVLVVGGGPAGSYAAAALALEGFDVILFEMAKFPRYHIGESLIPSVRPFLRFIDAEDKIAQHGFTRKPGSAVKFNQYMREGYTDFVALGAQNNAWNVVRSEFDQIMLQHAASSGARVFEQTRVTTLTFDNSVKSAKGPASSYASSTYTEDAFSNPLGRPIAAQYETTYGAKGEISFDYLVDATGRAGLMSTKYLKNRRFNDSLRNIAVWGYWRGTGKYGVGTSRENAPWFEALSDGSGWAWYIPLHKGLTSVGVVMNQRQAGIRSRASSSASNPPTSPTSRRPSLATRPSSSLSEKYLNFLHLAPGVIDLIGEGEFVKMCEDGVDEDKTPLARSTSDFSYQADTYAGEGWRVIGDAGSFIDPFFSSGIHLALTGALTAAATIAASARGDCSEAEAARWHTGRVRISYTRFLVVVLSAYKQMHEQSIDVLGDLNDRDFEKAFEFLRPLIQGAGEMGDRVSEDEVQRALDFCVHLFDPTTPEQHESARRKLSSMDENLFPEDPLDIHTPLLHPAHLDLVADQLPSIDGQSPDDQDVSDMKMVLDKINARRVIHAEHAEAMNTMEEEAIEGLVVRLRRGSLGLQKISAPV